MPILDFLGRKRSCRLLLDDDAAIMERFEHFRQFLRGNRDALNAMAELEQTYYGGGPTGTPRILRQAGDIERTVRDIVRHLNALARGRYAALDERLDAIAADIHRTAARPAMTGNAPSVVPLARLRPGDDAFAGGKATKLGLMGSLLDVPVPDGFAVTSAGFERFIAENALRPLLDEELAAFDPTSPASAESACARMREAVLNAPVPASLAGAIHDAYAELERRTVPGVRVAMRSSAIGEDTAASFAGQYLTELNVTADGLLAAYRNVLASKYTPRAVSYRLRHGMDDEDTPMCVACIAMVDSVTSGVLYTVDPDAPASGLMRVASVPGLGELLVGGEATPDNWLLDRETLSVVTMQPGSNRQRLVAAPGGGTMLEALPGDDQPTRISDETLRQLAGLALRVEAHFGGPQDIEWAIAPDSALYILQARPLGMEQADENEPPMDASGLDLLLEGGKPASRGVACGRIHVMDFDTEVPEGAILVAKASSPDLAALVGRIGGIIAETGSIASHLASVAREFRVPMLVDCPGATTRLHSGQEVTLLADIGAVASGISDAMAARTRGALPRIFGSPVGTRLQAVLDHVAPLRLTDPASPEFAPEGCATLHDIIRFAHEKIMRVMFGMAESAADDTPTIRLEFNIPMRIHFIDLGEGLRYGLTTCDRLSPGDIRSVPMKAFWKGLSHPGINWSGGVGISLRNLSSVMAGGAMAGGTAPGGDSYALVASDYMNISAKFGYHFANLDAYCSDDPGQNHAVLQFSGGIGGFAGKTLRLTFLGEVLRRLGYGVTITGDQLEARLPGHPRESMLDILDQTGRLLAASRLLDVGIPNQDAVQRLCEAFFQGEYDFLGVTDRAALPGFYIPLGEWSAQRQDGETLIRQDGAAWGGAISSGVAGMMGRMVGAKYQEFLDGLEAYFYFPLAIAKNSEMADGSAGVLAMPLSGRIDAAAGLAFGVRNAGNYFVWRVNALEDNAVLFEFVNNRRFQRVSVPLTVRKDTWYQLRVDVDGSRITAWVDGAPLAEYTAAHPVEGYLGLWTKADSTSRFSGLYGSGPDGTTRNHEPTGDA